MSLYSPKQQLVQQFLQFLHNEPQNDNIAQIIQLLSSEYFVSAENKNIAKPVIDNFLTEASKTCVDKDPKFIEFINIIKEKGYFKNVQEGTAAWHERYYKAKEKFVSRSQALTPEQKVTQADKLKDEGNNLLKQKKFAEAIQSYQKAAELNPASAIYHGNIAAAYLQLGDLDQVVASAKKAIEVDPKYAKAYKWLGMALVKMRKYDEAIKQFEQAKQLDPQNNEYDQRIQDAKSRLDQQPTSTSTRPTMGDNPLGNMPMPNLGNFNVGEMLNNPQFMQFATQIAQQPHFQQFMQNMMQQMGGGDMAMPDVSEIEQMPEVQSSEKLRRVLEEIKQGGLMAAMKHQNDPEIQDFVQKIGKKLVEKNPMLQSMIDQLQKGSFGGPKDDDNEGKDKEASNMYS